MVAKKNRVFIVILSHGVGGTEKRFSEIWLELRRNGYEVDLVVSKATFDALILQSELVGFEMYREHIHVFSSGCRRYIATLCAVLPTLLAIPSGAIVHYPLAHVPFVSFFKRHKLIVSWVSVWPAIIPGKWKESLGAWSSFVEARHIDVLNPNNFDILSRTPKFRKKLSLTAGGTIVNTNLYRLGTEKSNSVVFLGRFEPGKNALEWAERIPEVARILRERGIDAEFCLLGGGSQAAAINKLVTGASHAGIKVLVQHAHSPANYLRIAKIFLSLQVQSNYPSKALAEALACGCVPIITDVGESRLMCDSSAARFIDPRLGVEEIADAIRSILELDDQEFASVSQQIALSAKKQFSLAAQTEYFARLYHIH